LVSSTVLPILHSFAFSICQRPFFFVIPFTVLHRIWWKIPESNQFSALIPISPTLCFSLFLLFQFLSLFLFHSHLLLPLHSSDLRGE